MDNLLESILWIHKQLMDRIDIEADKLELTQTEFLILLDILTNPNTDLNAVCSRLSLNKSCASKALKSLGNYIIKETNTIDKRYIALRVNEQAFDQSLCKKQALANIFSNATSEASLLEINEQLNTLKKILET